MGAIALLILSLALVGDGFLIHAGDGLKAVPYDQDPVRTGDVMLRGLKASDFPRVTRLADNVYAFEQIDPTKRTVTVNNLIVITSAGVLIAESQGTVDNVKRLVADIAKLTPQPIRYVVVGSEHGDHTGLRGRIWPRRGSHRVRANSVMSRRRFPRKGVGGDQTFSGRAWPANGAIRRTRSVWLASGYSVEVAGVRRDWFE